MPGFSVQSYIITIILILYRTIYLAGASLVVQWEIICLPMQVTHESQVQFLGWEDLLEKKLATHSSILAWRIPWKGILAGYSPWVPKSWTQFSN